MTDTGHAHAETDKHRETDRDIERQRVLSVTDQ